MKSNIKALVMLMKTQNAVSQTIRILYKINFKKGYLKQKCLVC